MLELIGNSDLRSLIANHIDTHRVKAAGLERIGLVEPGQHLDAPTPGLVRVQAVGESQSVTTFDGDHLDTVKVALVGYDQADAKTSIVQDVLTGIFQCNPRAGQTSTSVSSDDHRETTISYGDQLPGLTTDRGEFVPATFVNARAPYGGLVVGVKPGRPMFTGDQRQDELNRVYSCAAKVADPTDGAYSMTGPSGEAMTATKTTVVFAHRASASASLASA